MKYGKLLIVMASVPSLMYGMDLQNVEFDSNIPYNINKLTETFVSNHQDLFNLIPEEQHIPLVNTMNKKKSKNKNNEPINNEPEPLKKNYNALFLSDDNNIKNSFKNVLRTQYANLYRSIPQFYEDEVLNEFINKHSNLVNEIIQKK